MADRIDALGGHVQVGRTRVSYTVIFVPAVTIHRGADRLAP
jgi:hypothetical protein